MLASFFYFHQESLLFNKRGVPQAGISDLLCHKGRMFILVIFPSEVL